jgi:hypothetical protein
MWLSVAKFFSSISWQKGCGVMLLMLLVACGIGFVMHSRWQGEISAHRATRATMGAKITALSTANNLLLASQRQANATIAGLQAQVSATLAIEAFTVQAAEDRCAIISGAHTVPAESTPGVVDAETSKRATEHMNATLDSL